MFRRWLLVSATVAAIVVGCTIAGPRLPMRADAPVGDASQYSCTDPYPYGPVYLPGDTGKVPDGFAPVAAFTCDPFLGPVAVDHTAADYTAGYSQRRWEGDFTRALQLLNRESDPRGVLTAGCNDTYDPAAIDEMWLIDAHGRAVRPGYPLDECDHPKVGGLAAVHELTETSSVEHRVVIAPDQLESVTGCVPEFAAPVDGRRDLTTRLDLGWFCTYIVGRDGAAFDGNVDAAVVIDSLATAPPCATPATKVAVADTWDIDVPIRVLIEFDGCRRVIADGYRPLTATEDILQAFPS